jgi:hypothetical protein
MVPIGRKDVVTSQRNSLSEQPVSVTPSCSRARRTVLATRDIISRKPES